MSSMRLIVLLFTAVLWGAPAGIAVAVPLPAIEGTRILVDPDGLLTVEEVAAIARAGGMTPTDRPRTPMALRHPAEAVWVEFSVKADTGADAQALRYLEVGRAILERVQLFTPLADGRWAASGEQGSALPFSQRVIAHRHFVFPLRVPSRGPATFLLRVSYAGPAPIDLTIWDPAEMAAYESEVVAFLCLYFGLAIGIFLHSVLLSFVVRDRGYRWYAGMVACTAAGLAAQTGMGARFVWPELTWWNSHAMYVAYFGALAFGLMLTRDFMRTPERLPRIDRLLKAGAIILCAGAAAAAVAWPSVPAALMIPSGLVLPPLLSALSILGVVRRWPGASYFLAAWVPLLGSLFVQQLRQVQLAPNNVFTANSIAIGSGLEMILLSLALANRINEERRQKQQAQFVTLNIVQALHAFASETRLERLHDRIVEVMMKMSGATAVRLLLRDRDGSDWFVCREADRLRRVPLAEAAVQGEASKTAFDAARSQCKPVREGDLLALPVLNQGEAIAVVQMRGGGASALQGDAMEPLESIAAGLALSLENVLLYERLEQRVQERTSELREAQRSLVTTARAAGMAEIATNVLHNVGNTLNSVNVAADLMRTRLVESRLSRLRMGVEMLSSDPDELRRFLLDESKGRVLPGYLRDLVSVLEADRDALLTLLKDLRTSVEHINNVVAVQQSYAQLTLITEPVKPAELVEDALRIVDGSFLGQPIQLVKDLADVPPIKLDRVRAMQILVNLLTNARQAIKGLAPQQQAVTVRVAVLNGLLRFEVNDCGCGIAAEHMSRLFSHGFTTREEGHGFGLHSCAVAARELGGRLTAQSDGPGAGASFVLELPFGAALADV